MSLNRAQIIGNLGHDPEVRYTAGGTAVANLSLATNERWKDGNGEQQEHTEWHKIVAWGDLAERAGKLHKGDKVYVEGPIQTSTWENDAGVKRYKTEVKALRLIPIGSAQSTRSPEQDAEPGDFTDEDIPF